MKLNIPTVVVPQKPTLAAAVLPVKTEQEIVAAKLGEIPEEAGLDLNLVRAAMTRGVLVDTRARRWRGYFTLNAQDCGIVPGSKVKRSNERIGLIPEKILERIERGESYVRRSVVENGFRVPGGYRGYFVPLTQVAKFKRQFDEGKQEVLAAMKDLADGRDKHEEFIRRVVVPPLIKRAWMGHRSTWAEGGGPAGQFTDQDKPTEAFVETFTMRIICAIPPPEFLLESVDVGYTYNLLHLPEVAAAVNIAADNEALNREIRASLEEQRESLPRRFIEAVLAAIGEQLETLRQRAMKAVGDRPGPATKTYNAALSGIAAAKGLNLIGDKRVEHVLRDLEMELRKAQALANGRQQLLRAADYLPALQRACEAINEMTTGFEAGAE